MSDSEGFCFFKQFANKPINLATTPLYIGESFASYN